MRADAELKSIIAQMSLEEKACMCAQSMYGKGLYIGRCQRLGLEGANVSDATEQMFESRAPLSKAELEKTPEARSTCFPSFSALASSWNRELLREIGEACGLEARARGVQALLKPGVNIKRSPLCGRNYEYFSEDPYLAGELAGEYINGIQSTGTSACLKHFAANNQERERMVTNAVVDERTLREIYLEPFRIAIKNGEPWTVMTSYNSINGFRSNDNKYLIQDVLRGEWGYEGVVQSDGSAVQDNKVTAHANGLDVEGNNPTEHTPELLAAVADGRVSEALLDDICLRQLRFAERVCGPALPVDYEKNHALAIRAATDGAVLLQNDGLLPLDMSADAAVIGAMADFPVFMGSGASFSNPRKLECALGRIESITGKKPPYAPGYVNAGHMEAIDEKLLAEAEALVAPDQTVLLFAGLPYPLDSESDDRASLCLPAGQTELINRLCQKSKNIVLCIHAGSVVELAPFAGKVRAILYMGLGGEGVGAACADILYGLAEPGGRINESFPLRLEDSPAYISFPGPETHLKNVVYGERIYVGYRYYEKKKMPVLFPFGHGLSYTGFQLSDLRLSSERIRAGEAFSVRLCVKNTGSRRGAQVVQIYVRDGHSHVDRPEKELKGFGKIYLDPGQSGELDIRLGDHAFSYWSDEQRRWIVEEGEFEILAGVSSEDIRLSGRVFVESEDKWLHFDAHTATDLILKAPNYQRAAEFLPEEARHYLESMGFLKQVPACRLCTMSRVLGTDDSPAETILTPEQLEKLLYRLNTL